LHCGDLDILVTGNCHSALQHLRKELSQFKIWLDAICIYQADSEEKIWQTPLMGDIYGKSKPIHAWLGEATPATHRAHSYLVTNDFEKYFSKSAPVAAAWSLAWSFWSWKANPIPFFGKRTFIRIP
jgi:hypothetical protein